MGSAEELRTLRELDSALRSLEKAPSNFAIETSEPAHLQDYSDSPHTTHTTHQTHKTDKTHLTHPTAARTASPASPTKKRPPHAAAIPIDISGPPLPAGVCPDCRGTGFILTPDGASPCPCRRNAELREAWQLARIPRKFLAKSLSTFSAKSPAQRHVTHDAHAFIKTFRGSKADHPGRGLLFRGKEGTGKTHVAVAILKEVIAKGYSGLYWNVPELFLELRRLMSAGASQDGLTEADLFDRARRVDLLVLDDLGAERTSEYVLDRLYVLINGRYENDTATVITTNRNHEELRAQIGPRIASRICEMCIDVEFPEGDYRRANMK